MIFTLLFLIFLKSSAIELSYKTLYLVQMSVKYANFVKPAPSEIQRQIINTHLTGDEAKLIYLNEIKSNTDSDLNKEHLIKNVTSGPKNKRKKTRSCSSTYEISDNDLFLSVQNNDVDAVIDALNHFPAKINKLDDFGWSLLMIACQANCIETAQELLNRGIDTSVRDKAGNSARSIIIKSKNYELVNIMLNHKCNNPVVADNLDETHGSDSIVTNFFCETCNMNVEISKHEHLSSTIHNINLSKDKKIPSNFKIPQSNKGYQIMVKEGWDRESGLGPCGSGKKYPIKTIQKKDRHGLGHGNKQTQVKDEKPNTIIKSRSIMRDHEKSRHMEVNFRRQFY